MVELPFPLCTQVWLTVWSLVASPVQLFFAIAVYRPQGWPTVGRLVAKLNFSRWAGNCGGQCSVSVLGLVFFAARVATVR
jgi:hypothetical protein